MNNEIDPVSLRMKVRVSIPLEFTVGSGESLTKTDTERALEPLMQELDIIRKMKVPNETINYRDEYQAGAEIREVRVSVTQNSLFKADRAYLVSHHTIRGR